MKPRVVLAILDGWGIGKKNATNPLHTYPPQAINELKSNYSIGSLQSSGIAVGLPWGEEGNSEVGHLTIGAGKIIYQHYPRITLAVRSGAFAKNKILEAALAHAKKNNSGLNLIGTLSKGNVHASMEHLEALLNSAKRAGLTDVKLHLFADGKDSPPRSLLELLAQVESMIKSIGVGRVASVIGRYFALDRDEHWNLTEIAYRTLVGQGPITNDLAGEVAKNYAKGFGDEFFEPRLIEPNPAGIKSNDSAIFFDFREDSIRQLAASFLQKDFNHFARQDLQNIFYATMTHYSDNFDFPVVSPPEVITEPLGKILADAGLTQMRVAETQKYAHVTYFFNGYRDAPYENEYRVLVPSQNIARPDEQPAMMAKEIATRVIEAITGGGFDFVLANFANADVIAHTGNYEAAMETIKVLDQEIARIAKTCLEQNAVLMITSDHGNIEVMLDARTGQPETKHDANLVPFYLIGRGYEKRKTSIEVERLEQEAMGLLADVAPTILEVLGVEKPKEMSGQSLLRNLR